MSVSSTPATEGRIVHLRTPDVSHCQAAIVVRLEREEDNFRQALRWTLDRGDDEAAHRVRDHCVAVLHRDLLQHLSAADDRDDHIGDQHDRRKREDR